MIENLKPDEIAERTLSAMMTMAITQAHAHGRTGTEWVSWMDLRLAFYPASETYRFFDDTGPIAKGVAQAIATNYVVSALKVPA